MLLLYGYSGGNRELSLTDYLKAGNCNETDSMKRVDI
jgi:hypothetical protein